MMESETESTCRICTEDAQYNIFQDELVVDNRNMKIYMVLNNFIFEKLYGPDEFSDLICMTCCDSLFKSYKFMLKIRDAEHKLRTEGPPLKKKIEVQEIQGMNEMPPPIDLHEDLMNENLVGEDILEGEFSEEDQLVVPSISSTKKIQHSPLEKKIESPKKRMKQVSTAPLVESVTVTNFSLVHKEENSQLIANIHIGNATLMNVGDGNYEFDNWLNNSKEANIYSCIYCVKGFSSTDFLLKHITSCHLCLTCFKICENNKVLNQHMKVHNDEKLVCPFCGKLCTYGSFRGHVRRQHIFNLPNYIGILPQNIMVGNED